MEMIQKHGTKCKSVHLAADGMSCSLEKPKNNNCKLLHWAWEGVFRPVLQRVMSLISTNPHQILCAETAVSPVALLQSSCGNDTETWDSMQISAPGCRCDELYFGKTKNIYYKLLHWAWEGVYRSVLQRVMSLTSTNPHQMLRAETAVSPVALLQSSCGNDTESWNSMQISADVISCTLENTPKK